MDLNDAFPQEIIREIEARGAVPKPRWKFFVSSGVVWALATASVLVGGIAFAVAEFVFVDNDGFTKLQGSSIQDIAQSIPFVWLAILAFFSVSAYYSFRHTRRGYKYATASIVATVIILSIALGFVFNQFDLGQNIQQFITGSAMQWTDGAN